MISDYYLLFVIIAIVILFCWLKYLKDKQKREHNAELRKNRIAIFSSMTKEEFENSKKILDYGNVTTEELRLLKDAESSTKQQGEDNIG